MAKRIQQRMGVNRFAGINRFTQGTVTPPNEFETIQNMHPVNPGELRALQGVSLQTGTTIPGVGEIVHAQWLNTSSGDRKLIAVHKPNITSIPAPNVTSANFTTSGGGAITVKLCVTYVGPGGAVSRTLLTGIGVQNNLLTFTLPTDIPDYVGEVMLHIQDNAVGQALYAWAGSAQRRKIGSTSVFPTSIVVDSPSRYYFNTGDNTSDTITARPTTVTFKPGNSGTLAGGRVYFIGMMPWVHNLQGNEPTNTFYILPDVAQTCSPASAKIMSFFLPDGYSSIEMTCAGLPGSLTDASTSGNVLLDYMLMFIGTTAFDLTPVGATAAVGPPAPAGTIVPVRTSALQSTGISIREMPYNASLGVMSSKWRLLSGGQNYDSGNDLMAFTGTAIDYTGSGNAAVATLDRSIGVCRGYYLNFQTSFNRDVFQTNLISTALLGAWVIDELPFDLGKAHQIFPTISQPTFNAYGLAITRKGINGTDKPEPGYSYFMQPFQNSFLNPEVHSCQFGDKLYLTNGLNTPFYTNGYCWNPIQRDAKDTTTPTDIIPIALYCATFKDQLILAGGKSNFANTNLGFYASNINNPFNFTGSGGVRFFSTLQGDQTEIVGLGVLSQDLDATGPASFLVVGKRNSIFTWNGYSDSTGQITRLDNGDGFCGPNALVLTNMGPIVIGSRNVYMFRGSSTSTPIGYEISTILAGLNPTQLYNIQAVYHENVVKLFYPSASDNLLEKEIWLDLRTGQGGLEKYYSGPHVRAVNVGWRTQAATRLYSGEASYRVVTEGANIYRIDDPGQILVNGAVQTRKIVISRLSLGDDITTKIIDAVEVAMSVGFDTTFTLQFDFQDGTTSTPFTMTALASVSLGQALLMQADIPQRIRARVVSLTLTASPTGPFFSIFGIFMPFTPVRRSRIR